MYYLVVASGIGVHLGTIDVKLFKGTRSRVPLWTKQQNDGRKKYKKLNIVSIQYRNTNVNHQRCAREQKTFNSSSKHS